MRYLYLFCLGTVLVALGCDKKKEAVSASPSGPVATQPVIPPSPPVPRSLIDTAEAQEYDGIATYRKFRPTPIEREALALVEEDRKKNFWGSDDTWTTQGQTVAISSGTARIYTQYKGVSYQVDRKKLTEADKLNGIESKCIVFANAKAVRGYIPDAGGTMAWAPWSTPRFPAMDHWEMARRNGKWEIEARLKDFGPAPDPADIPK